MNIPLEGIRVLDLSAVVVGPYATKILADHGADVIKVETREGDLIRWIAGPSRTRGMSGKYLHLNAGKRSIALDLKSSRGREAVLKLAATADVLTINMRTQAIDRLGLDYATIEAVNPRIVYCSMLGFGRGGRYRDKPAYDSIIQGASGMAALHERASGTPRYLPMVIADRTCGLIAANSIMMALFARTRTGRGQAIEVPMYENMSALVLAEHLYAASFVPPLGQAGDPRLLDPEARPILTADGYICVTANTDEQAFALMDAIGRPELKHDARFATKTERAANSRDFFRIRAEEIAKRPSAEWLARLEAADVPVMPYHTLETLPDDPHLTDVGLLREVAHPTQGTIREIANPTHFSDYTPAPRRPAPEVGEHTREILAEAGYAQAAIDELIAAKAAFSAKG